MIKHSILWFHVWDSPTWSQNWQSKPNHEERNTTFTWAYSFCCSLYNLINTSNQFQKPFATGALAASFIGVCVCCHVFVAFLPAFFFRLKRWTAEEQHDLERSPVLQWDGGLLNCHSWDLSSMTSFNRWASSWLSPCGGGFLRSFLPASQQSAVVEPAAPWCVSGWLKPRACRSRRSKVGSIPSSIPVPNTRTFLQSPVELLHTCTASPCWNPALQSPFLLSRAVPRRAASGNAMTLYGFIQLLAAECSVVCAEEKELSTGWECHKVKL